MCCFWWIVLFLFIGLFILTKLSPTLKFHIKYLCLMLSYIFVAPIPGVFYLQNATIQRMIFTVQGKIFGFRVQIEDVDYLKNIGEPVVIIGNHQSIMEVTVGHLAAPLGTASVVKKSVLYVPFFGVMLWLGGTLFIDRSNAKSAKDAMRKAGNQMKEKNITVGVWAEGTRQQKDRITTFKKGGFHLAVNAQVPIVPLVIFNYRNVIDCKNRLFEGGVIRVKALPAIPTAGLTTQDVNSLTERVHQLMSDAFDEDFRNHAQLYEHLIPLKDD